MKQYVDRVALFAMGIWMAACSTVSEPDIHIPLDLDPVRKSCIAIKQGRPKAEFVSIDSVVVPRRSGRTKFCVLAGEHEFIVYIHPFTSLASLGAIEISCERSIFKLRLDPGREYRVSVDTKFFGQSCITEVSILEGDKPVQIAEYKTRLGHRINEIDNTYFVPNLPPLK